MRTMIRSTEFDELIDNCLAQTGVYFDAMTGGKVNTTELVAALISQKETFVDGIKYAQDQIDGTMSILILTSKGAIIAARDKFGRIPVLIGKNEDGYAVTFESYAYQKLGYFDECELGPGEIVKITPSRL